MLNPEDHSIVLTLKDRLIGMGIPLRVLYVFGSRARGDANEQSDLDILAVVQPLDRKIKNQAIKCAGDISLESGVLIECLVTDIDPSNPIPSLSEELMESIRAEGVLV